MRPQPVGVARQPGAGIVAQVGLVVFEEDVAEQALLRQVFVDAGEIGVLERGTWRPDDEAMLNGAPIPRVAFESEDLEADLARLEMAG